ncbi:MAG TPA: hypothetical protein VE914_14150 [Candidatus Angelobacter sp.]|nr:hypothetical protein [Candidatus Angelobacter sp.]
MFNFRFFFAWAILFSILAGWLIVSAKRFDGDAAVPTGMSSQTAMLSADADPAALQRAALNAFTKFARLEARFDLAFIAYYHEKVAVHFHRLLPDGGAETLEYGRAGWADLQKHWFSGGAERSSQDAAPAYSRLCTRIEGGLVIIEGKRRIESEGHTGPYKVAMVRTEAGDWKIIEEWLEAKL